MKFHLLPSIIVLASCQTSDKPLNKFSDPTIVKIADLKDRRQSDSLNRFLTHENPIYRSEAALAFGSVQDSSVVDGLGKLLLMDPDAVVRKAAAFALGQTQAASCERLLLAAIVKEKKSENVFEILQAYGKTTRNWNLKSEVFAGDSVKTAGLAWSLYRAGLRGKTDQKANDVAAGLLESTHSNNTRLGAAHFFARGAKDFADVSGAVRLSAERDPSAEVRMAATQALGKVPSNLSLITLRKILDSEKDSRVLVNAVRALRSFPYDSVSNYLYEAVRNNSVEVGIAASEVILETIPESSWIEVSTLATSINQWRILANLSEAALKAGHNKDMAGEIETNYRNARDPYARAAMLAALKHYPPAIDFVVSELLRVDTSIIRSTAASTLTAMNYSRAFKQEQRSRFATVYKDLMETQDDPAVLGSIATALADSTLGYRDVLGEPAFLYTAKSKLRLPEHNEALQPVEAAIAYFERRAAAGVSNEFNHPIDWKLVAGLPADLRVTIKTTRGNIRIRLFVNESPGSVANFISLARQDYFDDKLFHRVVPNFVIQAGCKRGDGWGSEDYSIRSEFSPRLYRTGSVGMASAGKDTEGTQWFITHSPTPHLDGRYTIFAEVVEGMRVIDYIEVGDRITDVVIEGFKGE